MLRNLPLLLLLAAVLGAPFALRPKDRLASRAPRRLVVLTPHNEAIRREFGAAFRRHIRHTKGFDVDIDWRTPGGVSEITRYLAGEYLGAFEYHWTHTLKRPWSEAVRKGFDDPKLHPDDSPADDSPQEAARREFLASNLGIGIDLFFGGGSFDFNQQAEAGRLVDSGILQRHPEWFGEAKASEVLSGEASQLKGGEASEVISGEASQPKSGEGSQLKGGEASALKSGEATEATETTIPRELGGEPFWDPRGRWVGTCLAAFGICTNTDVSARLGVARPVVRWEDLAGPALLGQLALTDPTKSGSATKAFEMLVQQQMHAAPDPASGWDTAMRLIQRIGANARYFTDSGSKPAIDVSLGDAAAGMTIDFYGRFQAESVARPDGSSRMAYVTPPAGSSIGADPVALLRGANDPELARDFIDWLLTLDAQKLWNFKVGAPGGPEHYALRRLPIRPELYRPEFRPFRSDPDVDAYADAAAFEYRPEWTGPLFNPMRLIIRVMCLDSADELREAWRALVAAGFPPDATALFDDVALVGYDAALRRIRPALASKNAIEEVRLSKELGASFRARYRKVAELAAAHGEAPAMSRRFALAAALVIGAFLACFLGWPIVQTLRGAFVDPDGHPTLAYIAEVFRNPIYVEGLRNSFLLAAATTSAAALLAVPLAFLADRFNFPLKNVFASLVLVPMILPPFVGAIGVKQMLGQCGALNALLSRLGLLAPEDAIDWLGHGRFWGIVAMNALSLYPILYLNASAALANLDPALGEAAENLGCTGLRKHFRITLPLIMPGLFAGGTVVFIAAFTDLGVPLMFDYSRVASVQIFSGIKDIGGNPFPYALVAVMLAVSATLYAAGKFAFGRGGHAMTPKATSLGGPRPAGPWTSALCVAAFGGVAFLAMLPHLGVILVSLSSDWYRTILPTAWSLEPYRAALGHPLTVPSIGNSLLYASLATGLDLILGVAIAYLVVRSDIPGRQLLDLLATLPLAVPGLVLAFGYLAMTQEGRAFEFLNPARDPTLLLVIAYGVRRLPYVVRSATAGLQQTSATLEEAAQNLGCPPLRALRRITLPLIAANLIAGALLAFAFAMLEVSDSLLLAQRQQDFPITKAIYELFGLLGEGRFVASALGVWAMLFLGLTIFIAGRVMGRKLGALFRV